ncbi:tetratricopeptide repeat protein [Halomonas halocynthiae]|uniref:tetratricopeptide repeat protein n=1 Tax=Halomonas halocynthiae TaxID=176290 RepID=UPI000410047D|nr:SEC-C domain-containing protein [Halomonas halocynthiae]
MLALWVEQLLEFASGALAEIRKTERYPDLVSWARLQGAGVMDGGATTAQALAPELWSQTPLERLNFACEPLARPGPTEPCWCDSGRRTRDCCATVELLGGVPEHLMWMLSLREWKGPVLKAALHSGLAPAQALLEAGLIEAEIGQSGRAQQMLESLFHSPDWSALPEQCEPAFEMLIDLYQERGFHRKREALLSEVLQHGPLFLRGVALERLCLLYLDSDDLDSARDAFVRAQQTLPDSPTLAYLEAMLLLHEGNEPMAIERSRFWFRRLSRQGELEAGQLQFLADLAEDPAATLAEQLLYAEETLAEPLEAFQELLKHLPEPPSLNFKRGDNGAVIYQASQQEVVFFSEFQTLFIAQLEDDGLMNFDQDPWLFAGDWLPALCAHPEWLAVPNVLQSLIMALTSRFGSLPWMVPSLLEPLSAYLEVWLDQAYMCYQPAENKQSCQLDWEDGDNAVLLGAGLTLVVGMERGAQGRSRRLAEVLMSLDEQDALGLRELVLDQLLRAGRDQEALALSEKALAQTAEQGADDAALLGVLMGQVLALYRLGRKQEASETLDNVRRHNPYTLPALCAENLPPITQATTTPGSRGEARQYCALMRDQWRTTPHALEWLASQDADR